MATPMQAIPVADRPREKLIRLGAEKLSNAELLAILLRTGRPGRSVVEVAQDLLDVCERREPEVGLRCLLKLRDAELDELVTGVGKAKLCQVLAALQLGQRFAAAPVHRVEVSSPAAVAHWLMHATPGNWSEAEQFQVILVNAKNKIIDVESVSTGTLTAALVHPRDVFLRAIRHKAHAIIVAHNHPSGDPSPSREDREVTHRLVQAGKLIGIEVLDHIIIGDGGRYVSFRERGLVEWT